jgi:hypothetical protein
MLSAGGYPVMLASSLRLLENALVFAWLRTAHGVFAYLPFLAFLAHMGATLYHGLTRRDGVLRSIAGDWRRRCAVPVGAQEQDGSRISLRDSGMTA